MPILDLLASITGEKPTPSPNPPPRPSSTLPKRKAEDELRPAATAKTARVDSATDKSSRPNGNPPKPSPRPADQPPGNRGDKASSATRPSLNKPGASDKPGAAGAKAGGTGASAEQSGKSLPARPLASRPASAEPAPLKKRSFAEIMARAKANSEQRESLGKIQHKTIERGSTMKERKDMKAEEARNARIAARKTAAGKASASGVASRNGTKPPAARDGTSSESTGTKKVKKAALATIGYTGTARPRPGTSSAAKAGPAGRPSSEAQSRDRARYRGPSSTSRRKYEEEDDDLDDFIEYDEEDEEEQGFGNSRRYRYDSYDDESDMEAGLSDIEDEELEADRHARREDMEQEALERRLKQEKEERKRRLLEAAKAKAKSR